MPSQIPAPISSSAFCASRGRLSADAVSIVRCSVLVHTTSSSPLRASICSSTHARRFCANSRPAGDSASSPPMNPATFARLSPCRVIQMGRDSRCRLSRKLTMRPGRYPLMRLSTKRRPTSMTLM